MRVHVLGGVCHHVAVPHDVQHGDVVIRVAEGGHVCEVDAQVLDEVANARPLVDADVHEVQPFVACARQIQAGVERGGIYLIEVLLAVPTGEVDRDLVGVDVELVEGVDVGDGAVVDAEDVLVPAVALEHIGVIKSAEHRHAAGRGSGQGEHLMIEVALDEVSINKFIAQVHGCPVVGDDGHVGVVIGEGLPQGEAGPAARRAKDDSTFGEGVDALADALGHRFVVGQQGEVHVGRDELDGGQVVVGEVGRKHGFLSRRVGFPRDSRIL